MGVIHLYRHTETEGEGVAGSTDVYLSEDGKERAEYIADHLLGLGITTIIDSDMHRTRHVTTVAQQKRDRITRIGLPSIREHHFGIWEGKRPDQIAEMDAEQYAIAVQDLLRAEIPEKEPIDTFRRRIQQGMETIREVVEEEGIVAVIGHFQVNRMMRSIALAENASILPSKINQDHGCRNQWEIDETSETFTVTNCTRHLEV